MTTHIKSGANQDGFTLVELLIVAIILAILAAIVVPQFANSTAGARDSSLRSSLAGIRSAIDLYAQQHANNDFPGEVASTGGACAGGTAGSGALDTPAALQEQLIFYSNAAGQTCSIADVPPGGVVEYPFGPYVKGVIPSNPVTNNGTITVVTTGDLAMVGAGPAGGWRYDTTSGKYIADDTNTDTNGVAYDSY